tara:strand:- start:3936 stop:4862 length:927 start_codon:yes stop_codon:yes gene_type:complete
VTWLDYGTIFQSANKVSWAISHAYVPTAMSSGERIRVFVAFLDEKQHGRLGYIDVSSEEPWVVIDHSKRPLIEDAVEGRFDQDGVTPLSIVSTSEGIRLYYVGWKTDDDPDIRYRLFVGALKGDRCGNVFERISAKPVIGPRYRDEYIRTGAFILPSQSGYHCWLATQKGMHSQNGKATPIYDLEYMRSLDGLSWPETQETVFPHISGRIAGYGRSAIWLNRDQLFEGLFPVRNWDGSYTDILYSTSEDGINWAPLSRGGMAFRANMTCDGQKSVSFPNIIHQDGRKLMFYNGNDFGREGLRLAIWTD